MLYYVYWGYVLLSASVITLVSLYFVKALQDCNYSLRGYWAWVKGNFRRDGMMLLFTGIASLMLKIGNIFFIGSIPVLAYICFYGADLLFLYLLFSMYLSYRKKPKESDFRVGPRNTRILIVVWLVSFLCEANMMRELELEGLLTWGQYILPYFIGYLPGMALPFLTLLSFVLTSPALALRGADAQSGFYMSEEEEALQNAIEEAEAEAALSHEEEEDAEERETESGAPDADAAEQEENEGEDA